mmetsp:Transcript_16419/g.62379  ORF Transcript_16419/g.62379 Transcript_16419/m.62379 type:complete len:220 (-) Transcript_16419:585-1244(-)|eukprot:scaffold8272_cov248-Pinguiococcus_pyrenoidosus.AAC.6
MRERPQHAERDQISGQVANRAAFRVFRGQEVLEQSCRNVLEVLLLPVRHSLLISGVLRVLQADAHVPCVPIIRPLRRAVHVCVDLVWEPKGRMQQAQLPHFANDQAMPRPQNVRIQQLAIVGQNAVLEKGRAVLGKARANVGVPVKMGLQDFGRLLQREGKDVEAVSHLRTKRAHDLGQQDPDVRKEVVAAADRLVPAIDELVGYHIREPPNFATDVLG